MKWIFCGAAALLLMPLLCLTALAAGSAQVVRAFVSGNTLYTYVELSGVDSPVTQVEAKIGTQSFPASGRLETVQQAGYPITYLLLVDNSTSMPAYREELTRFCTQLTQDSGEHTQFILATFGDRFQVVEEELSPENLDGHLSTIPFNENVTRLHSCINSALDYFETIPRQGNELRALVMLTDAVQYDPDGETSYEELLERIGHSDVMLHSLGLGDDRSALDSLGQLVQASGGSHQVLDDAFSPEEAASALTQRNGALLVTGFDLTGCTTWGEDQSVSLTFASNGALVCRSESTVNIPEVISGGSGEESPSTSLPIQQQNPGPAASDIQSGVESAATPSDAERIPLLTGIVITVVVVVVAILLFIRRKKRNRPESTPSPVAATGIYIRLDASGELPASQRTEFMLSDLLTIGRDALCDIVLPGETVPPQAVKISADGGLICLEPLDPQPPILVNGQPVQDRQPLRSGDHITISGYTIRLLF